MLEDPSPLGARERIVIFAMEMARDEMGQDEITKRELMTATALSKPTLISILGDFVDRGWVTFHESFTDGGRQNPTMYKLTQESPPRRTLMRD